MFYLQYFHFKICPYLNSFALVMLACNSKPFLKLFLCAQKRCTRGDTAFFRYVYTSILFFVRKLSSVCMLGMQCSNFKYITFARVNFGNIVLNKKTPCDFVNVGPPQLQHEYFFSISRLFFYLGTFWKVNVQRCFVRDKRFDVQVICIHMLSISF